MGLLQEQRVPLTTDPFLQLPQPKKKKKKKLTETVRSETIFPIVASKLKSIKREGKVGLFLTVFIWFVF